MNVRALAISALIATGFLAIVAFTVLQHGGSARALPPAGTDNVSVIADAQIAGRAGSETIHLTGTAAIQRQAPHDDGGVQVSSASITAINVHGDSLAGPVSVAQSIGLASTGELRSLGASEYPASSFFDVYVDALIPSSGTRTEPPFYVHNETPIHISNQSNITSWPPYGVKFQMAVGTEPTPTATSSQAPGGAPDCTNGVPLFPQDPNYLCVLGLSLTMSLPPTPTATATPCVPTCTATPTITNTRTPTPSRTPSATRTSTPPPPPEGPENPTFSVAPGGPSGFPANVLLALAGTGSSTEVSGNDNFGSAWQILALPFRATESTIGTTTETSEPKVVAPDPLPPGYCISLDPHTIGATVWFKYTPITSGTLIVETAGSSFDSVLAAYTGSALNSLTQVACDDDTPQSLQSLITLPVDSGTTYYFQVGGFVYSDGAAAGTLNLHVTMSGSGGSAGVSTRVAVPCLSLGLSQEGCSSAPGPRDYIHSLSAGTDFVPGAQPIFFTVAPGSTGVAGSGVAAQAACTQPEPQADEFASSGNGTNYLFLDGDGQGSSGCPTAPGLGLKEQPTSDDLVGLTGEAISQIDVNGDGVPDNPVYFTLATGSPSLVAFSRSPADILWTAGGFNPGTYATAAQLGLQAGDDIDGLCIADRGTPTSYDAGVDTVEFSLAPGSPTLAAMGASPADVLGPGPQVLIQAGQLGLTRSDNLQDMKCFSKPGNPVTVQVGDIWFCDSTYVDATCDTIIHVGDTVVWDFTGAELPHTTTECGDPSCANPVPKLQALWNSGDIGPGSPVRNFQYTFTHTGFYYYYCQIHGPAQRGRIIVVGSLNTPTPTRTRTPTPTRTATPSAQNGDANKDGHVDSIDAALMLQYSAGIISSINPHADVNHDGHIDSIDAALVLQFAAGLITNLP